MKIEEYYTLTVRGKLHILRCAIFCDGYEVGVGEARVFGKKNFKIDVGKKLALASATRDWFNRVESEVFDQTDDPIIEPYEKNETSRTNL